MNLSSAYVVFLCMLCMSVAVAGDPPSVDRIHPPGGQRGTSVEVTLVGNTGDADLKFWSNLGQLQFDRVTDKPKNISVLIPADASPGIHRLRFYNENGTSTVLPFAVGIIPEVMESEPNNSPVVAQPIDQPSVTINGVLEKSADVDVYSVVLKAEQTLVASILANRELGSPMDSVMQILDANGVVLQQVDDDHALDPQIVFTAPTDGRYFVRVFAFPSAPNSTIKLASGATFVYRLTLTTEGFVDFTIPAAVDGTSETQVVLHGWNLPGNERRVVVSPQRPDSFLVTEQLASSVRIARSAQLSLTEASGNQLLDFPCSVSGLIEVAKEHDVFRFAGTKGQKLTFTVEARANYSSLDPVLRVRNETGAVVRESDDVSRSNQDSEARVSLPADGSYTVEVTDRYDSGSRRHFYVLTGEHSTPQISATAAITSVLLHGNDPAELDVAVNRINASAESVRFSVEGLPSGVTAEPVVSEAKGESATKLTLKIQQSASTQAFSGLISIIGQAGESRFPVTAAIPDSEETMDSLWLTVVPSSPEKKNACSTK